MQNPDEQYQTYRTLNPLTSFVMWFGGIAIFLVAVLALFAGWSSFLVAAPSIIKVLLFLLLALATGTLLYLAVDKGMDIRLKHRRELREQQRHDVQLHLLQTRIHADERGNKASLITASGTVINLPAGNYIANVPQTLHITHAKPETRVQEVENDLTQIEAPAIEQPTFTYCISQLEENALQVCLGVSATTGKPFVIDLIDGVHYKFIGASGMGKSCLAGAILAQALKTNDPDTLQVALLDLEHKTSRLFENMPHVAHLNDGRRIVPLVATDANEVAFQLSLLHKELDRRAAMSEQELQCERFLLIYVEEFLSLQYEVDEEAKEQMLKDFSVLAVRGRKYGMYLLACAQVDYADNDLRNAKAQFRVKGAFGVVPSAAASAGFMSKDLIKQNYLAQQPGQFVLETRGCNDIMLAPQYDVKARLARLNSGSGRTGTMVRQHIVTGSLYQSGPNRTDAVPPLYQSEPVLETRPQAGSTHFQEVQRLRSLGWGKVQIIEKVWNAKKGGSRAYVEASAEYDSIVAQLESED